MFSRVAGGDGRGSVALGAVEESQGGQRPVELAVVAAERRYHRIVVSPGRPWWPPVHLTSGVLRFSGQAKRLLSKADAEATRRGHDYLGPGHILLGLLTSGDNAGSRALHLLRVNPAVLREQVADIVGDNWGRITTFAPIQLSPPATAVLQLARRDALRLGASYVGSEHILLGLAGGRAPENTATQVLGRAGVTYRPVRDLLSSGPGGLGDLEDGSLLGILGRRLAAIEARLETLGQPAAGDRDHSDRVATRHAG
jgi:hypothetical protein